MEKIDKGNLCVGCRACYEICPKQAIQIIEDEDGFAYPIIDEKKCIKCGLCEKTCPLNFNNFKSAKDVKSYIGVSNDLENLMESSSGGAFYSICEVLIEENYTIYGVEFDENFQVIHNYTKSLEHCKKFRKSKYIISNTNGCFSKIVNQLKNDEKVLFSGSPCQVAALYLFLKSKNINYEDKLITCNVLCHGAGSQKLFDIYLKELQKKNKSQIVKYNFKSKKCTNGKYNSRSVDVLFSNNKEKHLEFGQDPFLNAYYTRLFYRESCSKCRFTTNDRASDITLGDAWGIDKIMPNYNPLKGVSLILANTKKGEEVVEKIAKKLNLEKIDSNWALKSQGILNNKPTTLHKNRRLFLKLYKRIGFYKAVNICTWSNILKLKAKKILKYNK